MAACEALGKQDILQNKEAFDALLYCANLQDPQFG